MPREKKQRISTDAGPAAWTSPFAALDAGTLPPGRAAESPAPNAPATPARAKAPAERLLLRRSTAHRGGKTVLVLEGFSDAWPAPRLENLLGDLKRSLGCGGTLAGRTLEIQGEQADRLQTLLEARGFAVKRGW